MRSWSIPRHPLIVAVATAAAFLGCTTAYGQQEHVTKMTVSPAGFAPYLMSHAPRSGIHLMRANTPAGALAKRSERLSFPMGSGGPMGSPWAADNGRTRYPGDLQYHGGQVVRSATEYLIFVNMPASGACNSIATCWGNPAQFLSDLGKSDFAHIADQYTNSHDGDRYLPSPNIIEVTYPATSPYTGTTTYSDLDMETIVYYVTTQLGLPGGYHAIYDVFLPPGQDECTGQTSCYSPDNPGTFAFCAYHGMAVLPGVGDALYTVEPFQDVAGCSVRPNTPNGQLVDSTNNVLSHETFETITDPNVAGNWPTGYWNELANGLFGQEIGDECSFLLINPAPPATPGTQPTVYFDPSNVELDGRPYAIQPEYSNSAHGCATSADDDGSGWGDN